MIKGNPKLERRLQLATRKQVNAYLGAGWHILSRNPMQMRRGRQVATFNDNGTVTSQAISIR